MLETRGRWIHATAPDERERERLVELGVPPDFLRHALDVHEPARVAHEGDATLIILRVPHLTHEGQRSATLGVVLRDDRVVTIAAVPIQAARALAERADLGDLAPFRCFLELMLIASAEFVNRVDAINDGVERVERALQSSLQNRELLGLLEHQKSLVYLERALASNELMLGRLGENPRISVEGEHRDLLGDAIVEVKQALQMTRISTEILSNTMDAFATIISNNLNVVMKRLAALTVLVAIPGVIAGLWGMNVSLPAAREGWAFLALTAGSLAIALAAALVFAAKKWL
jgi:magnesium transporter